MQLLAALVERDVRIRRKRSWFGVVWPALAPLFLMVLYVFVFRSVFRVPIPRYSEFLFAGLLPWTFLAQALGQSVTTISSEGDLVRRTPFHYELLPVATVVVMGLYFLITLFGFVVFLGVRGHLDVVVLPVVALPIVALFLLVSSIAMILSLIDVYNRDLRQLLGNLLTIWFFLVPVVYRAEMAPSAVRFLRSLDPMNMIVGQFRDILHYGQVSRPLHTVLMLTVCSVCFMASRALFRHFAPSLPKDV
ncbi:MAG: ABC transporter permease [Actinomycetota bacterium]|nr:ABC transporter permease [Actinomycetota bacterium]